MSQLKRFSLWAATAAIVAEAGLKNVVMTALVTVATPATATGFVYEVMQMRHARLEHEAEDRAAVAEKNKKPVPDESAADAGPPPPPPPTHAVGDNPPGEPDFEHRLKSMLIAREHFIDLYGDNPEAIAPAYQKVAQDMLGADDRLLSQIEAQKDKDPVGYLDMKAGLTRLHEIHAQIATLVAQRVVTIDTPVTR